MVRNYWGFIHFGRVGALSSYRPKSIGPFRTSISGSWLQRNLIGLGHRNWSCESISKRLMMANMEYSLNPPPMSKLGKYADEEEAVRDLPPCFVRSLAQLAVYDPARNATGPKLTVREAFRTFGRDKLEEAIEYGSAILLSSRHTAANALKNRRATLGVSHAEVARAAAASERDVRIAEEPLSEIPLRTLYCIALILGLDERYLSQQNSDSGDHKLAVRLKTLQYRDAAVAISRRTALTLAEAASIIRIQNRLQEGAVLYL